jgi:hypothetical protein
MPVSKEDAAQLPEGNGFYNRENRVNLTQFGKNSRNGTCFERKTDSEASKTRFD